MSQNILVINTSPIKGGNDDLLCDAFIKGAKEAGKNATKIEVIDYNIKPCYACGYCIDHPGHCAQKDDWMKLYQQMEQSDAIVFSSPLYYGSICAWMKIIIDRFYMQRLAPIKSVKKVGFMCVSAVNQEMIMRTAYACFQAWLSCMDGIEEAGTVFAPGFGGHGEIKGSPYIEKAEAFGQDI